MKTITLLAVVAMLLVDLLGSKSSVGGPMTDLLVAFIIMLVVGVHESRNRGPLGWILNIVLAVIGGLVAISLMGMAMDTILALIQFQGRLVDSNLIYIVSAVMAILAVLGSWIPLQIANRLTARFAH